MEGGRVEPVQPEYNRSTIRQRGLGMSRRANATVEDLYGAPDKGKAEIVNGELILMAPTGGVPARAGGEIYVSLREHERRKTGCGYAFPDNVGFLVDLPNRSSLSPDAAFYIGELRGGLFLQGGPVFAAEVRNPYSPSDLG